jgi:AcrR family transcriptional regulator
VTDVDQPQRLAAGRRPALTRDRVLAAAVELADAEGIEALSMRRLARVLGVEAMSLYHHTKNKDDILAGMLERVLAEIEPASDELGWKAAVRGTAIAEYQALRRHAWAPDLLLSNTQLTTTRLRRMDALLASLRAAGFADELIDNAYHAIDIYVTGFALWQSRFRAVLTRPLEDLAAEFLRDVPLADYPDLAAHVGWHLGPTAGAVSTFEFGLDLILEGLERARGDQG